jgi:hypothetical protein
MKNAIFVSFPRSKIFVFSLFSRPKIYCVVRSFFQSKEFNADRLCLLNVILPLQYGKGQVDDLSDSLLNIDLPLQYGEGQVDDMSDPLLNIDLSL